MSLIEVVKEGNLERVKEILEEGININIDEENEVRILLLFF